VLAFVMLPTASIVGFFSTAMSARRESAGYEPGIAVRQLADVVTNVLLGQIAKGTKSWEIPPVSASLKGRSTAHILDAAGQRMEREQQAHE